MLNKEITARIQSVIPVMVYGSETWILYRHQMKKLRTIQQRHLRPILKIKWDDYITNDEVLDRAVAGDIETYLSETDFAGWGMLYDCRMMDQPKHYSMGN